VSAPNILAGYRYVFCALLVITSAQAVLTQGHEHAHAALLGAAEATGALLLVGRKDAMARGVAAAGGFQLRTDSRGTRIGMARTLRAVRGLRIPDRAAGPGAAP
jgi:hypothetical protein